MNSRSVQFGLAFGTTVADISVGATCGPALWEVYGAVPWMRIGLLIIAGAVAFTLMDVWSKTVAPTPFVSALERLESADV